MLTKFQGTVLRHVLLCAVLITLVGVAQAGPIMLDPQSSYLLHSSDDVPGVGPLFISMESLGASVGSMIRLQAVGYLCFHAEEGCQEYPAYLGAAFTIGTTVGPLTDLNRLAAVGAGIPSVESPATYEGGIATDIPEDFEVPFGAGNWLYVTVPTGATHLAVGVLDSAYYDNGYPTQGDDPGILAEFVVPEPGTWVLFGAGLGALAAVRRLKRVRR